MGRPLSVLTLSEAEEETLRNLARRRSGICAAGDTSDGLACSVRPQQDPRLD